MISRFMSGLFSGIFTGVIPLYLNELPPQNYRGIAGTFNQLSIVFGILIANILGLPYFLGNETFWPILVSLPIIPALVHLIGLLFAVESPKFLFNSNKVNETKIGNSTIINN
jgi:MFS family permease